jgi:hypothetical protein
MEATINLRVPKEEDSRRAEKEEEEEEEEEEDVESAGEWKLFKRLTPEGQ